MIINKPIYKKWAAKAACLKIADNNLRYLAFLQKENTRQRLFKQFGIDLTIDVGANVGQFAEGLRNIYAGEILSFEPVKSTYDVLLHNSRNDDRWSVFNVGLGQKAEEVQINISSDSVFSSFRESTENCKSLFGESSSVIQKEMVKVKRLDDFLVNELDRSECKIFLKMDTQGFDDEVFSGSSGLLDRIQILQSEVSVVPLYEGAPDWHEALKVYEHYGFTVAALYPVNLIENRVIEYDCILVKRTPR